MSREHRVQEGKIAFPLGVSVQGDVIVSVYHMRSTIGGRLQAKVNFMCSMLCIKVYKVFLLKETTSVENHHVCVLIKLTSSISHQTVSRESQVQTQNKKQEVTCLKQVFNFLMCLVYGNVVFLQQWH